MYKNNILPFFFRNTHRLQSDSKNAAITYEKVTNTMFHVFGINKYNFDGSPHRSHTLWQSFPNLSLYQPQLMLLSLLTPLSGVLTDITR